MPSEWISIINEKKDYNFSLNNAIKGDKLKNIYASNFSNFDRKDSIDSTKKRKNSKKNYSKRPQSAYPILKVSKKSEFINEEESEKVFFIKIFY